MYSYKNAVLIICDSIDTSVLARSLFATRYPEAIAIDAAARAQRISDLAKQNPLITDAPADVKLKSLIKAHKYIMDAQDNPHYHTMDIEKSLGNLSKKTPQGNEMFHVILMSQPLFSNEQIKQISCRKIYFYENRSGEFKSTAIKEDYCRSEDDSFESLGFQGSLGMDQTIDRLYESYGFDI